MQILIQGLGGTYLDAQSVVQPRLSESESTFEHDPQVIHMQVTVREALLYKNTRIMPKLKSWPAGLAEETGKAASRPSAPRPCRTCLGKPLSPIQGPLKGTMAQLPRFPEAPTALGHLLKTPAIPCTVLGLASSDAKSS